MLIPDKLWKKIVKTTILKHEGKDLISCPQCRSFFPKIRKTCWEQYVINNRTNNCPTNRDLLDKIEKQIKRSNNAETTTVINAENN